METKKYGNYMGKGIVYFNILQLITMMFFGFPNNGWSVLVGNITFIFISSIFFLFRKKEDEPKRMGQEDIKKKFGFHLDSMEEADQFMATLKRMKY